MTYYNSAQAQGGDLREYKAKASSQDLKVLEHFKSHPGDMFSPEDVMEVLFTSSTPLTSIRRSFNSLEKGLFIEKTGQMKKGIYDRLVNCWKLRVPSVNNQLELL